MKRFLILLLVCYACGNEKYVQLPEVERSEINEVLDVSPIYIFYDETKPDSTDFNRKNMISTTNWLVNIDKRLAMGQVLPHLQYLQEKRKKGGMHKNENAKNYFTCNDTSINNLGFLEFTNVVYSEEKAPFDKSSNQQIIQIDLINVDKLKINGIETSLLKLNEGLKDVILVSSYLKFKIQLQISKVNTFQSYISLKSILGKFQSDSISVDINEFFY